MYTRISTCQGPDNIDADPVVKDCTADEHAGRTMSTVGWKCTTITSCSASEAPSPRGGCSWTQVGIASSWLRGSSLQPPPMLLKVPVANVSRSSVAGTCYEKLLLVRRKEREHDHRSPRVTKCERAVVYSSLSLRLGPGICFSGGRIRASSTLRMSMPSTRQLGDGRRCVHVILLCAVSITRYIMRAARVA